MKNLNESEFLSFLYAEKDRLHTNYSKPGWSNWAIGGAFVALIIYIFNILVTPNISIDCEAVLMVFISLLSVTIIGIMIYPSLFPKIETYYYNRITTLWDESPILELTISGLSFLIITIFLIVNINYSWILYVFGYLSLERLITLFVLYCKRNKLVASGTKYTVLPTNLIGKLLKTSFVGLFISIAVYSSWDYIREFYMYKNEIQISATLLGFWLLIFIFFKTNSTPNKMLNGIDNIIDKFAYSTMCQQDVIEELMFMRYGGRVKQVVENDLSAFFNSLSTLNDINMTLDKIIQNIDNGKLDPQTYFVWQKYLLSQTSKLEDANYKGSKIIEKTNKILKLPNNAMYSSELTALLELVISGQEKIKLTFIKYQKIWGSLNVYKENYYCRKIGSLCLDLQCKKRNDRMSVIYAFKAYPIKYVIKLFIYRKL